MKILHLICYFNDGLDYQENRLIKLQKKNNNDVCLITSNKFYPFKDYKNNYSKILGDRNILKKEYNYFGAKIIRKKILFEFKNHSQCFFFNLLDIIKFSPDVIHIHNCGVYNFFSSFIYALIFKRKIFIDCHQDEMNTKKSILNKFHYFLWKFILKVFQKKISLFLPINESSKKYLINYFNIKEEKIKISPLGFDSYNKKSVYFQNRNFDKFRIKKNAAEFIIINSGKQNKNKKITELISLVKILNKKKFNCKLLLIGKPEDEYKKFLEYKIRSTNLSIGQEKIINIGFQKKKILQKYLELTDIAIWPGNPSITIQEALYADNLILLPSESPSSNLLVSKYLYFDKNLNTVAKNLIYIFSNKTLLNRIKCKNEKILNQLSWNKINNDLEEIYRNH